ncbi:hypothetical protein BP5796_03934 [Coleophoma crateriformis]|uniref:Uncharacterized protein n=1 Tax=Coleophoma crateriformis TaxID=565419 RepID=A0A3D8SGY2_9HELO|nr:hypothetical protein BP5796_03934 [Coleophoma crateriformis]
MNCSEEKGSQNVAPLQDKPPSVDIDAYVSEDTRQEFEQHEQNIIDIRTKPEDLLQNHRVVPKLSSCQESDPPEDNLKEIRSNATNGSLELSKIPYSKDSEIPLVELEPQPQQGSLQSRIKETQLDPLTSGTKPNCLSEKKGFYEKENMHLIPPGQPAGSDTQERHIIPVSQEQYFVPIPQEEPVSPASQEHHAGIASQNHTRAPYSQDEYKLPAAQELPFRVSSEIQPHTSFPTNSTGEKSLKAQFGKLPTQEVAVQQIQGSFKFGERAQNGTRQIQQLSQENLSSLGYFKENVPGLPTARAMLPLYQQSISFMSAEPESAPSHHSLGTTCRVLEQNLLQVRGSGSKGTAIQENGTCNGDEQSHNHSADVPQHMINTTQSWPKQIGASVVRPPPLPRRAVIEVKNEAASRSPKRIMLPSQKTFLAQAKGIEKRSYSSASDKSNTHALKRPTRLRSRQIRRPLESLISDTKHKEPEIDDATNVQLEVVRQSFAMRQESLAQYSRLTEDAGEEAGLSSTNDVGTGANNEKNEEQIAMRTNVTQDYSPTQSDLDVKLPTFYNTANKDTPASSVMRQLLSAADIKPREVHQFFDESVPREPQNIDLVKEDTESKKEDRREGFHSGFNDVDHATGLRSKLQNYGKGAHEQEKLFQNLYAHAQVVLEKSKLIEEDNIRLDSLGQQYLSKLEKTKTALDLSIASKKLMGEQMAHLQAQYKQVEKMEAWAVTRCERVEKREAALIAKMDENERISLQKNREYKEDFNRKIREQKCIHEKQQTDLNTLATLCQKLREEITSLKQVHVEAKSKNLEQSIDELRVDLKQREQESRKERTTSDLLQNTLNELPKKYNDLERLLEQHRANISKDLGGEDGAFANIMRREAVTKEHINEISTTLSSLKALVPASRKELIEFIQSIATRVEARLQDNESGFAKVNQNQVGQLKQIQVDLTSLRSGLEEQTQLKDTITELREAKSELSALLSAREKDLQSMTARNHDLSRDLVHFQSQLSMKTKELEIARALPPDNSIVMAQLQELKISNSSLKEQIDTTNAENSQLRKEMDAVQKASAAAEYQTACLQKQCTEAETKIRMFAAEKKSMQAAQQKRVDATKLDMARKTAEQHEEMKKKHLVTIKNLEQACEEASLQKKETLKRLQAAHEVNMQDSITIANLRAEIEILESCVGGLREKLAGRQEAYKSCLEVIKRWKESLEILSYEFQSLRSDNLTAAQAQVQFEKASTQYQVRLAERDALEKELLDTVTKLEQDIIQYSLKIRTLEGYLRSKSIISMDESADAWLAGLSCQQTLVKSEISMVETFEKASGQEASEHKESHNEASQQGKMNKPPCAPTVSQTAVVRPPADRSRNGILKPRSGVKAGTGLESKPAGSTTRKHSAQTVSKDRRRPAYSGAVIGDRPRSPSREMKPNAARRSSEHKQQLFLIPRSSPMLGGAKRNRIPSAEQIESERPAKRQRSRKLN